MPIATRSIIHYISQAASLHAAMKHSRLIRMHINPYWSVVSSADMGHNFIDLRMAIFGKASELLLLLQIFTL